VLNQAPANLEQVFFAAWVRLETEQGDEQEYRIVGPDEIDFEEGYISLDSPLARALLKRSLDDQIEVETPAGVSRYWIIDIRYENS
jgi:transcription elongation factor GreB